MGKIKLAICLDDKEYRDRFVKCLMNHYRERYELHVFEEAEEVIGDSCYGYHGCIISESMAEKWKNCEHILVLNEENRYQEVYRIVQQLETILGDAIEIPGTKEPSKKKVLGVFSLAEGHLQLPFATMLAELSGEDGKVILVDLQAYSGLASIAEDGRPGLEDVMAAREAGNLSKARMQAAIGNHHSWDYIYPVKNAVYLQEGNPQMLADIIRKLTEESEYMTIIINLGEGFGSMQDLIALCDTCYLLHPKGCVGSWREEGLIREARRRGSEELLHRIRRVETPTVTGEDEDWEILANRWKWEAMGDCVRHLIWEAEHGQTM